SDAGDGTVRLWDMTSTPPRCKVLRPLPTQNPWLDRVALTPEGRHLAVGNPDGTVHVLRLARPGEVLKAPAPFTPGPPTKVPEPAELAKRPSAADALKREDIPEELLARAGGGDPKKAPAELAAVLRPGAGHTRPLYVAFSPDGKTLAVSSEKDPTIRLWDLATGKLRRTLKGHGRTVFAIAFSPDGQTLASPCEDGVI